MPKNKKPAGGRPARNFDPSYASGAKKKPGSRSPGHRGHRPEEPDADRKPRWSRDERVSSGRSAHRSERPGRAGHDGDERAGAGRGGPRGGGFRDRDERAGAGRGAPRSGASRDRDERAPRGFERDERPARFDKRDDRAPRRDRDERAPRRADRDDRAPRRFDRDDRAPRRFDRDDRAPRRFDRDERAPRRPVRDERAPRYERDDRAPRRDRDERAPRRDREFDRAGFRDSGRRPSSFYPAHDRGERAERTDDVVLERLDADAIQAAEVDGIRFADLGLGGNIVQALGALGAESPFPIQAATIPVVLEGRDVLGRGRTGSGKTIAFAAPTVERLMQQWAASGRSGGKRQMGRRPRALILAPTRELALQIDRTVQPIAQSVGLFTTQIYGGVPQGRQVGALQRGVDIVIGTPGRIEDLIEQGRLDLSDVRITVLDEADHMCDLGFLEPVQRILRRTAEDSQKLLFSATLDSGVAALVEEFLVDPAVHEVAGEDQASGTIEHRVLVIEHRDKRDIVAQLADRNGKTLIFTRTRAFAEDLTDHLEQAGIFAVALHGDLNQGRRTRNLQQLTSGRVDVLVATDVAARGIHVDDIDLVIQADAPDEYKTYLHRSGRTGRAGRPGRVVTLVPRHRRRRLAELLDRAEISVELEDVRLGDPVLAELGSIAVTS